MKNAFVIALTGTIFGIGVALAAPDEVQDQPSTSKADTAIVGEGTTSQPQARTQATSRNPQRPRRSIATQKWTPPAKVVRAPAPGGAPAEPAAATAAIKPAATPVAEPTPVKPVTATPSEGRLKGKITRPGDGGVLK